MELTHWVGKITIIGSDNGLSPGRRQAIIWTSAGMLLGTNFSEIWIGIKTFFIEEKTFENVICEMLSISSRPQCEEGNVNSYGYYFAVCTFSILLTIMLNEISESDEFVKYKVLFLKSNQISMIFSHSKSSSIFLRTSCGTAPGHNELINSKWIAFQFWFKWKLLKSMKILFSIQYL